MQGINDNTPFSLKTVAVLLAVAFSYGILYWKVEATRMDVHDLKLAVEALQRQRLASGEEMTAKP